MLPFTAGLSIQIATRTLDLICKPVYCRGILETGNVNIAVSVVILYGAEVNFVYGDSGDIVDKKPGADQ